MLRKSKNINLIILLLSGIIIFAHAIIPHDHHYGYNTETTKHHEEQNHSGTNNLLHCDALNNFIIVKSEVKINKIQQFKSFSGNDILKQLHISDFKFTEKAITFPENYLQLPKYIFSKIEPARGSPEIS